MRNRISSFCLFALVLAVLGIANTASAQTRDQYFISAKAGVVNLASGIVMVNRKDSLQWQTLTSIESIESGDRVKIANGGRLEFLLNPGSYVRVEGPAEFELTNASLDSLQISLLSGSTILEMTGTSDTELLAEITVPQNKFVILRSGLYRINASPTENSQLFLRKGKIAFANNISTKIKDKKKIIMGEGAPIIGSLDKNEQDVFDMWCQERAKLLASANSRFSSDTIAQGINYYQGTGTYGFGYAPYFGIWVFNPLLRCYVFLPFYSDWCSPFGYNYWGSFGLPWWDYRPYCPPLSGGGGTAFVSSKRPAFTEKSSETPKKLELPFPSTTSGQTGSITQPQRPAFSGASSEKPKRMEFPTPSHQTSGGMNHADRLSHSRAYESSPMNSPSTAQPASPSHHGKPSKH